MSLPYPEPGIRLIRQDRIDEFTAKIREFQTELAEAVENLDRHYYELKTNARQQLGSLFNAGDYPESLATAPSRSIATSQASNRQSTCNSSIRSSMSKSANACRSGSARPSALRKKPFTAELAKLASHLTERLNGPGRRQAERRSETRPSRILD